MSLTQPQQTIAQGNHLPFEKTDGQADSPASQDAVHV